MAGLAVSGGPTPLTEMVVHQGSDWAMVRENGQHGPQSRGNRMDVSVLPTEKAVRRVAKRLNKSSCAVVGASSALNNCADICSSHDVILKVNFHPLVDRLCPRSVRRPLRLRRTRLLLATRLRIVTLTLRLPGQERPSAWIAGRRASVSWPHFAEGNAA